MLVCIDARLVSGASGGVESVLIGLASGLSRLKGDDEQYVFMTLAGQSAWLEPYVSGPCRIVEANPPRTSRTSRRAPWAANLWRRIPVLPAFGVSGPPASDGTVERLGADVVHQVLQKGFLTEIPTVFNPHDLQHLHLPDFFTARELRGRELRYRRLADQAALVGVTSSWGQRDLITLFGLSPDKVRVIPWAPILDEYPELAEGDLARATKTWNLPERFILYPAQTWAHKNHQALLEAMALLRDRSGLSVTLVAPGFQNAWFVTLKRRTAELGLTDQVRWLGFVSTKDLRALYRLARAVVIPTRFEAASGPLWEAFQAGTPAACSNVTSLPEQAGGAAIVFDPDRIDQIAEAIQTLWSNEDVRQRLVERGKSNIARFSWDLTAHMYRAWYRRIAGNPPTPEDQALIDAPPLL